MIAWNKIVRNAIARKAGSCHLFNPIRSVHDPTIANDLILLCPDFIRINSEVRENKENALLESMFWAIISAAINDLFWCFFTLSIKINWTQTQIVMIDTVELPNFKPKCRD